MIRIASSSLLGLLVLAGCASDPNNVSFGAIKANPEPEMLTMTERKVDTERAFAIQYDQNWRQFWQDLGRALYIDHPSRMSPISPIYTSGQPR
jgi:hypothetical protein